MWADFFRQARWLDKRRVRAWLWIAASLNVVTLGWLIATSRDGIDRNGFLLGTDFLSFWTTGRMLLGGQNVYDMAAHIAAQQSYYVSETGFTAFFYPPTFLPFVAGLGTLGYFPALAVWLVLTGGAYALTCRLWIARSGLHARCWLAALAYAPILLTITHGQTSFLVAALLGAGALLVRDSPVLAGICFGLATIKPQFGVLVPLALLLTREWRVIVAASITALLLAALSALAFGPQVWADWLAASQNAQLAMQGDAVGFGKMISTFAALKLLGASSAIAYAFQAAVSLGVAITIAVLAWRRRFDPALGALMLVGALLTTPFVLDYDLTILAFPLIWLAAQTPRDWERFAILCGFAAPLLARPLAVGIGVPIMPLVLGALFILLARRLRSKQANTAQ